MADFAMCQNSSCELSQRCRRFTAKPNPFGQCYMTFRPEERDGRPWCDSYWPAWKDASIQNDTEAPGAP